jgi:hypothetical protein
MSRTTCIAWVWRPTSRSPCATPLGSCDPGWSAHTIFRTGNAALYYPEANVLVPRHVDPRSKTPAFKSVLVEIAPESGVRTGTGRPTELREASGASR